MKIDLLLRKKELYFIAENNIDITYNVKCGGILNIEKNINGFLLPIQNTNFNVHQIFTPIWWKVNCDNKPLSETEYVSYVEKCCISVLKNFNNFVGAKLINLSNSYEGFVNVKLYTRRNYENFSSEKIEVKGALVWKNSN